MLFQQGIVHRHIRGEARGWVCAIVTHQLAGATNTARVFFGLAVAVWCGCAVCVLCVPIFFWLSEAACDDLSAPAGNTAQGQVVIARGPGFSFTQHRVFCVGSPRSMPVYACLCVSMCAVLVALCFCHACTGCESTNVCGCCSHCP